MSTRYVTSIFFVIVGCTCNLPIDEAKINERVDDELRTMKCKIQARLSQALRVSIKEMCNNIDDDCDKLIDEDLVDIPCETACGQGLNSCIEGKWTMCDARLPIDELCNSFDDDCDGEIDELLSRPMSETKCIGGYERCANGVWTCDHVTPIMACTLVTIMSIAGPFTAQNNIVHWSYALHPTIIPAENEERYLTLATINSWHVMEFAQYHITSSGESEVSWLYTQEIAGSYEDIRIRASSHADHTLIGLELTQDISHHTGAWYLFDKGILNFGSEIDSSADCDMYGFIPLVQREVYVGLNEWTSKNLPPGGHVGWETIPLTQHADMANVFGFARPHSIAARYYDDFAWFAWRPVKNVIRYASWDAKLGIIAQYDTDETSDAIPIRELTFAESSRPQLAYSIPTSTHTEINVEDATTHIQRAEIALPLERAHIQIAEMDGGYAIASGAQNGMGGEYSYVNLTPLGLSYEQVLGQSIRTEDRAISVSHDIGGISIFVVFDDEREVKRAHIRCE